MCQVGLWNKNPTQFSHSLCSKDWGLKRNNRNPSSSLALAQQKAMGSLEMSELSLFWVSGIPAFETFVWRFHENGCFWIPWSLAVWAKRSLTAAHISILKKSRFHSLKNQVIPCLRKQFPNVRQALNIEPSAGQSLSLRIHEARILCVTLAGQEPWKAELFYATHKWNN